MSRAALPTLASAHPLLEALPAIYQEDGFAARLTEAFDEILAPIALTIDNMPAYFDPALTPDDFLEWLGGWVGVLLDETWPVDRRRALVAQAADLFRRRGTKAGIADHISILTEGTVEITDSGGTAWSEKSGGRLPGSPGFTIHIRVTLPPSGDIHQAKLDWLVAAAKPAHLHHTVEVVRAPTGPPS